MKQASPKKPRKLNDFQVIIGKHVEGMRGCYNPAFWKREMDILKRLFEKFGRPFMLWVEPIEGYRQSSLSFYMTDLGHRYLSDQLVEYEKQKGGLTPQKEEIVLSPTKIGDDKTVTTAKPKTLKDFLNLYADEKD